MKAKINSENLCPKCKRSKDCYLLDNRCVFCSYLHLHTGDKCEKFIETEETNNGRI